MYHSDKELFQHIFDEIQFLESKVQDIDENTFLNDNTLKRAFARSLEIIGEAVKNLSNKLITENPQVSWRNIAGMRDKLIHGYFSINYKLVWDVVKNIVPEFKLKLLEIKERNPEIFS